MYLESLNNLLAVNLDMKSTDYILALGISYFVIDRLFKVISNKKNNGQTNESEIEHRRQSQIEHKQMIDTMNEISTTLQGISAVGISTNNKSEAMKEKIIIIEDRIVNQ